MRRWTVATLALTVAAVLAAAVPAEAGEAEKPDGPKISFLAFGDFYWFSSSHDPAIEGENGFWLRRMYLTFDQRVAERWDARLRFEANSAGDFSTNSKLEPFIKDIWLRWKYRDRHQLIAGISPTPTWDVVEKHWGYRPVEKTPLDLLKRGSSRDFGVALKGKLGSGGRLAYHFMLGNGSSTGSETNEGKKVMLSLGFEPAEGWLFEIYGDAENRPGQTNRTTYQAFVSYRGERGRFGLQVARQNRETPGGPDVDLDLASVFGAYRLGERAVLLGRVDQLLDPVPEGAGISYLPLDPTAEGTLLILGVDFEVAPRIHVIPNVEAVFYDSPAGGGPAPEDDLVPRVTLFYRL